MRLVSNREFYWDQAFFTVDEAPVEILRDRNAVPHIIAAEAQGAGTADLSRLVIREVEV